MFYDSETQLSVVKLDLPVNIASQNIQLNYTAQSCLSTTNTYGLVSIKFEILNFPNVSGSLNITQRSFTIPSNQQSVLPLNEYFSVIGTAIFQSPTNQRIRLSLIYQIRFVSKLIVSIFAVP